MLSIFYFIYVETWTWTCCYVRLRWEKFGLFILRKVSFLSRLARSQTFLGACDRCCKSHARLFIMVLTHLQPFLANNSAPTCIHFFCSWFNHSWANSVGRFATQEKKRGTHAQNRLGVKNFSGSSISKEVAQQIYSFCPIFARMETQKLLPLSHIHTPLLLRQLVLFFPNISWFKIASA